MALANAARVRALRCSALTLLILGACSSGSTPGPGETDGGVTQPDSPSPDSTPPPPPPDGGPVERYLCNTPVPAGAPQPVRPPLPAAGCPTLVPGLNTITSTGHSRQFILVVPSSPALSESDHKPAVLFMWHWLGGSANKFLEKGDVQVAADQQRFLAVLPVSKGANVFGTSFDTRWPFDITQSQGRMNEELAFFDDMLACVEAQFDINDQCVSSVGVSAGALWTDQLAQARSDRLASFVSLSGGVSASIIKPWSGAQRKLPGVVLWGGDGPPMMDGVKDLLGCFSIGMDFSVASRSLESELAADGHFFVECKHNCGHVEPPLDTPPGESKYAGMWEFALDHPFWLPAGQSPWLEQGLPPAMPDWCGIGANSATPRSGGGCPDAENPCPS